MRKQKEIYGIKKELAVLYERIDQANIVSVQYRKFEKEATDKADQNMDIRLNGMNEFRDQLKTQAATFITREQYEAAISRMVQIENKMNNLDGRFAIIGILFGTFMMLLIWALNKFIH